MNYVDLTTAKYYQETTHQEFQAIKRARNVKAIRDFVTFVVGLLAMHVGTLTVHQMHLWRPHVESFLSATGLF